jgi:hypothetical protein
MNDVTAIAHLVVGFVGLSGVVVAGLSVRGDGGRSAPEPV